VLGASVFLKRYEIYRGGHAVLDALIAEFERRDAVRTDTSSDSPLNVLKYQIEYMLDGASLLIKGGNYFGRDQGAWISGPKSAAVAAKLHLPDKPVKKVRATNSIASVSRKLEPPSPTPNRGFVPEPGSEPIESRSKFATKSFRVGAPYVLVIDRNDDGLYRITVGTFIGASGSASEFVTLEAAASRIAGRPELSAAVLRDPTATWPELLEAISRSHGGKAT
jgi:hypothetical protein